MSQYQNDNRDGSKADTGTTPWVSREELRDAIKRRQCFITIADLFTVLGLAQLEIGQKIRRPWLARKSLRSFYKAVDAYAKAGLGRRADAVLRLGTRCVLAWQRFDEAQGFTR